MYCHDFHAKNGDKSGKWRISSGYYLMKNLQLFDSLVSRMVAASFAYIKITNKGLVTQKSPHCTFPAISIILAICQHIYERSHDIIMNSILKNMLIW